MVGDHSGPCVGIITLASPGIGGPGAGGLLGSGTRLGIAIGPFVVWAAKGLDRLAAYVIQPQTPFDPGTACSLDLASRGAAVSVGGVGIVALFAGFDGAVAADSGTGSTVTGTVRTTLPALTEAVAAGWRWPAIIRAFKRIKRVYPSDFIISQTAAKLAEA